MTVVVPVVSEEHNYVNDDGQYVRILLLSDRQILNPGTSCDGNYQLITDIVTTIQWCEFCNFKCNLHSNGQVYDVMLDPGTFMTGIHCDNTVVLSSSSKTCTLYIEMGKVMIHSTPSLFFVLRLPVNVEYVEWTSAHTKIKYGSRSVTIT